MTDELLSRGSKTRKPPHHNKVLFMRGIYVEKVTRSFCVLSKLKIDHLSQNMKLIGFCLSNNTCQMGVMGINKLSSARIGLASNSLILRDINKM